MSSENVDRLSTLPEEITSHILSLMPTKFAVRTSILSKRWRYSWRLVTSLDFEDIDDNRLICGSNGFSEFVDRVFECCKSPQIKSFRLHTDHSSVEKSSLLNWIDKAIRLNVGELDIHALFYELPTNLLTCKTLTKLRLDYLCSHNVAWMPLCQPVYLPCLKTLDVVVFSNPFIDAFKLINGSPTLESLSFEVKWREDEEDYIFNLPTLKQLKLIEGCASVMNKVILDVPNLEYLFFGGRLFSDFVMKDVSSLVEASVSLDIMDHIAVELFKGLNGVKSFSAQDFESILCLNEPSTCPLPFFLNLEYLDLKNFYHTQPVSWFLERSPQLKHLCIEKSVWFSWIEPESVPTCMLTNLETIKFSRCGDAKAEMDFLTYVLGNAKVLKAVTITWRNWCPKEQLHQLELQVLNFPRASTHCEFLFSKG